MDINELRPSLMEKIAPILDDYFLAKAKKLQLKKTAEERNHLNDAHKKQIQLASDAARSAKREAFRIIDESILTWINK